MPEDLDTEAIAHPEVIGSGARYDGNIRKAPEYFMTMNIDVKNIDKNDNNKWRTI